MRELKSKQKIEETREEKKQKTQKTSGRIPEEERNNNLKTREREIFVDYLNISLLEETIHDEIRTI